MWENKDGGIKRFRLIAIIRFHRITRDQILTLKNQSVRILVETKAHIYMQLHRHTY